MLVAPAGASAVSDPEQHIGGAGSKWFSGSLIQQIGDNCSVFGSPYTEVMVSGVGSYGGAPGGGVVHVNDQYWASLLVAIPGNPCGTGSSAVATDLVMPAHTSYDPTRQIRCFGTLRFQDDFFEVTNESWNFLGQSGRYCPTGPSSAPIGQRFGFRPLANGQQFWIFVPVKTTGTLQGAAGPGGGDQFNWLTESTGVYANPGRSYIWANVFQGGSGDTPFVYFSRNPSAIPFWASGVSAGTENRVEFFANLYSAGKGGGSSYLSYEIRRTDTNELLATDASDSGYNGSVPASPDLVQVNATGPSAGPNGGYAPFYFTEPLWDVPMRITWKFTYNNGAANVTGIQNFRTLAGPDLDGDGVGGSDDKCPNVKGTLPNGCLPGPPKLKGSIALKRGAKLRRGALIRGQIVKVRCNLAARAGLALRLSPADARALGLKGRTIGSARGRCNPSSGGKLKLRLTKRARAKVRGRRGATLTVTFTRKGSRPARAAVPVKIV